MNVLFGRSRQGLPVAAVALGLLGLTACSQDSTLLVRALGSIDEPTDLAGLRLVVGGSVMMAEDLTPVQAFRNEASLPVPNSGPLVVEARLEQDGDVVAAGSFQWQMRPGWEWTLDVSRAASDPTFGCFGCAGSASFAVMGAVAAEPGEALWFVWSGQEKGSDIIY